MDSTHRFGEHSLFAYGITDGILYEMTEEQQSSIISIIESMLSEVEDAISESLLSGEDASACSKKKIIIFFYPRDQITLC